MKSNIASQITDSRIQYDDTGAMFRIFDFDEQNSIDSIVIRFDPDDDVPHSCVYMKMEILSLRRIQWVLKPDRSNLHPLA